MNYFELFGFITGIIGIWLTIKENPWCFPVGLINVTLSLFLFFQQRLYADALQQFVYIILLSYGWYHWVYGKRETSLEITKSSISFLLVLLLITSAVALLLGTLLSEYTDASVPYLDSTATAISFAAQYLVAKKKIENWILWMTVNVMYVGIYVYKDLHLYVLLFALYFILAVAGFIRWKKILNENQTYRSART